MGCGPPTHPTHQGAMPVLTLAFGESIDLGGGVTAAVRGVGPARVWFRVCLPPGVSLRVPARPPGRGRPPREGRPAWKGPSYPGRAGPWSVGIALYPGGTAVIGE